MSTERQKRLAENIVRNAKKPHPNNKKELIVSSGYSEVSAIASPHIIINQVGVQEHLKKLGFHADNAKRVVTELLESDDEGIRIKAVQEVFKVEGSYSAEKQINVNLDAEDLKKLLEDDLRRFRTVTP